MKAPILLHIPEPCHENWDAMTPQDKGRHCQSCNKIVVDFSVMTDRQVLDYFSKTKGNTCGRFHDNQLQRPLIEPQTKPSKWSYFFATFLGFIMSSKLAAQGDVTKGEVVGKIMPQKNIELIKGDTILPIANEIKGKVVDEKGNVIAGASIQLKGTKIGVAADSNGLFQFKKLGENNKLTLVISSIGYEQKTIEISTKKTGDVLNVILKEAKDILGEVSITAKENYRRHKSGGLMCVRCFRYKELAPLMIQKIFNNESIKIYPNPAPKNSTIHITLKDAGEYSLQMFDAQSRLIIVKNIVTKANKETTEFQLPSTANTGTYYMRFINEATKKQVTEKIIIL